MSKKYITNSTKYHGSPCGKCGNTLRYSNGNCIPCAKEYARQWQKDNPEKAKEMRLAYDTAHPENVKKRQRRYYYKNREMRIENSNTWKNNNKERVNENARKRYNANPEKYRRHGKEAKARHSAKVREWQKANPDKTHANMQRYRARKNSVKHEPYNFSDICKRYGGVCLKCGRGDVKMTVDHVVPISKGGEDVASNIQPLCLSCNCSKSSKHIDYRPDSKLL